MPQRKFFNELLILILLAPVTVASTFAQPDISEYTRSGTNGGRGGLPQVTIWLKKSQADAMKGGEHSWSYPSSKRPDDMHYTSWQFWRFGLSDALLQLFSELATSPSQKPLKLGRYFGQLSNSSMTGWAADPKQQSGIEVDITDTTPVSESCRADHYVMYGRSGLLQFKGEARFLMAIDKRRHLQATVVSSNLSQQVTKSLRASLLNLTGHPVLSFPDNARDHEPVQLMVDFSIERQPGAIKLAR